MRQGTDGIESDVAPQLQPDVPPDAIAYRCVQARRFHCFADGDDPIGLAAGRLAKDKPIELMVFDDPRSDCLTSGIDDTSDYALRTNQRPLSPVLVD